MALYDTCFNSTTSLHKLHPGINWNHEGCFDIPDLKTNASGPALSDVIVSAMIKAGILQLANMDCYRTDVYYDIIKGQARATMIRVRAGFRTILVLTLI